MDNVVFLWIRNEVSLHIEVLSQMVNYAVSLNLIYYTMLNLIRAGWETIIY